MTNAAYSVFIPAAINGNPKLSLRQKHLYGRIMALANKNGYCFATNNFFANEFGVHKITTAKDVAALKRLGLIKVILTRDKNTKQITARRLIPLLVPRLIPISPRTKGSIKILDKYKYTKGTEDQPKTQSVTSDAKLSSDPLLPEGFPNFLIMKNGEMPKSKQEAVKLFKYWSKQEATGNAKKSLSPCTVDELLYLAKKNRIYYTDVLKKYCAMVELINSDNFKNKQGNPYGKTLYFTLSRWIGMDMDRGYIQQITDEAELRGQFDSPDGYLLPHNYKQRLMYQQLRQRKEKDAK